MATVRSRSYLCKLVQNLKLSGPFNRPLGKVRAETSLALFSDEPDVTVEIAWRVLVRQTEGYWYRGTFSSNQFDLRWTAGTLALDETAPCFKTQYENSGPGTCLGALDGWLDSMQRLRIDIRQSQSH